MNGSNPRPETARGRWRMCRFCAEATSCRIRRNSSLAQPKRSRASLAPAPSACSLAKAMSHRIGAMPQLVQGWMRSLRHELHRRSIVAATSSGVSTASLATSMTPTQHVLAFEQREQVHRHARVLRLDRHLLDAARGERREDLLVLPPLAAERRLPVEVRLDAVAVADVDGGGAGEAFGRAVQRLDAPVLHLVHVDVEGRLVELDDVDAVRLAAPAPPRSGARRRPSPSSRGRHNARRRSYRRWSSARAW